MEEADDANKKANNTPSVEKKPNSTKTCIPEGIKDRNPNDVVRNPIIRIIEETFDLLEN